MLLVKLVNWALNLFILLILLRCVISWFRPSHYHPVVRFIEDATEPFLLPIRKVLPPPWKTWGIDFSPAVAMLIAYLLAQVLIGLLMGAR